MFIASGDGIGDTLGKYLFHSETVYIGNISIVSKS